MSMKKQRVPAARRHVAPLDQEAGRSRRGEHDVDLAELERDVVERDRDAAEARRELGGALLGAVRDVGDRRTTGREAAGGQLPDPARPDEEHLPALQVAEDLRGESGRGGRDGGRALADRGLGADPLAELERLPEHPVEQRPGRGGVERGPHLAEDLALARDQRVEARRRRGRDEAPQRRRASGRRPSAAARRRSPRARRARAPRRRPRGTPRCGCRSRGTPRRRASGRARLRARARAPPARATRRARRGARSRRATGSRQEPSCSGAGQPAPPGTALATSTTAATSEPPSSLRLRSGSRRG